MAAKSLTIMGIDPGTATTGFGFIKMDNKELSFLACGHIATTANTPLPGRLKIIVRDLKRLIKTHQPSIAAVEELFFCKNLKTAIAVGQARGAILLTLAELRLPIFEYTPLQIKQTVTSYGRADKKQVQEMVKTLLKLKKAPQPDDAADALAVAICHAHHIN